MSQVDAEANVAATTAALGAALANIRVVEDDGVPFVVVPDGYKVESLLRLMRLPPRKTGAVHLTDARSFCAYVNDHKNVATRIYATPVTKPSFVAVLDDHFTNGAGWREHRAVYDCPLSVAWTTWIDANKKPKPQAEFAQFIEDNLPDIARPDGSTVLEIARFLEAKKKVNFKSGIRLANGETQFTYEEEIAAGGRGQMQVPEEFTLGLRVFEGGERYEVHARLRYRINDSGALSLWYDLLRPHVIIDDAVEQLVAVVADATGITPLRGTP